MKTILATLATVLLVAVLLITTAANATETSPDVGDLVGVCLKAHPEDSKAAVNCMMKGVGVDPDAPPSTQEELNVMYGEPDDPIRVQEIQNNWAKQLDANLSSITACKEQPNFRQCLIEAASQELAIHEKLLESLKPPAWTSSLGLRYTNMYWQRARLREVVGCETLAAAEKATCHKKMTDEIDRTYLEAWNAFRYIALHIAKEHMEREGRRLAARQREIFSHEQQLRQEESRAQREHELELARIQALGMALSGGGPFRIPMAPVYQPPVYQAPAFTPAPYQYLAPRQPTNCTSNIAGSYVYTNCY